MRNHMRIALNTRIALASLLSVLAAVSPTPALHAQSATASITESEIRDHIFYLASDELEGRGTGDEGYLMAARYAADQLRESGVRPLFQDEGGAPSFFEEIPMGKISYGPGNSATLRRGTAQQPLTFGQDYFVISNQVGKLSEVAGPLVFAGFGMEAPAAGWNDLEGLDLSGAIPIVLFGRPSEDLTQAFSGQEAGDSWQEFGAKVQAMEARGASAVVAVLEPGRWRAWNSYVRRYASDRLVTGQTPPQGQFPETQIPVVFLSQEVLTGLFAGRGFDPVTLEGEYSTFSDLGARLSFVAEASYEGIQVPNVVGWVEGTDPVLKDEYVVVGAHLDHLGVRDGVVYNGADDNASGSVGVLEIAEAMAMDPPKRSTLFVLYTGEERGLLGSRYFVENPPVPLDRILANVNIEMIGRYEHRPLGTGQLFAIIGTPNGAGMRQLVAEVNTHGFDYEWEIPDEFMGGSDHMAYEQAGIANVTVAASPPYGTHEDYHRPGDDPEKIDIPGMRKAAAFIYELTFALANQGLADVPGG